MRRSWQCKEVFSNTVPRCAVSFYIHTFFQKMDGQRAGSVSPNYKGKDLRDDRSFYFCFSSNFSSFKLEENFPDFIYLVLVKGQRLEAFAAFKILWKEFALKPVLFSLSIRMDSLIFCTNFGLQ